MEHETSLSVQRFHAMEAELDRQVQKDQLRVDFTMELQEEHAQDMAALQRRIEEVEQSRRAPCEPVSLRFRHALSEFETRLKWCPRNKSSQS